MVRFSIKIFIILFVLGGNYAYSSPLIFDEEIDGELLGLSNVTSLGELGIGTNIIRGSVDSTDAPLLNFDERLDGFHLYVPANSVLTLIEVIVSDFDVGSGLIGPGSTLTSLFVGSNFFPSGVPAQEHPDQDGIYSLFPHLAGLDVVPESTRLNFQVGASQVPNQMFSYEWRIQVNAVAEPSVQYLVGFGFLLLLLGSKRKKSRVVE